MYRIESKQRLNDKTVRLWIEAPFVARAAQPGQFLILRVREEGERIPLTIAGYDREKGLVSVIFQEVGATTYMLGALEASESLCDLAGPLGKPSVFADTVRRVVVIGGGLGTAIAYPQAKHLFETGRDVTMIAGFKNQELIILEEEMRAASHALHVVTDDGSNGNKGFVTDALKGLLESGEHYDLAVVIGPIMMMKFVCMLTKSYNLPTIVSMNPIMIDGTGMCGCCRLTVGGEVKFACVDGPDFDGHQVDFDETIRRNATYKEEEEEALHECRRLGYVQ